MRPTRTRTSGPVPLLALALAVAFAFVLGPTVPLQPAFGSPTGTSSAETPREQARRLGERAIQALNTEQHEKAIELLREAEELFHAPTHLLLMARAYVELGRLIEAHDAYLLVASESIPGYAPPAFLQAQRDARTELAELRTRLPTIQITVSGSAQDDARITIDGKPVTPARLAQPIALEPGGHVIEARAEGFPPLTRRLELRAGDVTQQIDLVFGATVRDPEQALEIEHAEADDAGTSPLVATAIVSFGVGLAALGVGAVTGGIAWSRAAEIQQTCVGGHCPPEQRDKGESTTTLGNVSTATFILGGIGVAAGVVLLLVAPGNDATQAASASLRLRVAPTGLRLDGAF